jgi:hypothetical protein
MNAIRPAIQRRRGHSGTLSRYLMSFGLDSNLLIGELVGTGVAL